MKKVAIFGNAGGGKSTLARKLAAPTKRAYRLRSPAQIAAFLESVRREYERPDP